jgi:hypothetical protein
VIFKPPREGNVMKEMPLSILIACHSSVASAAKSSDVRRADDPGGKVWLVS